MRTKKKFFDGHIKTKEITLYMYTPICHKSKIKIIEYIYFYFRLS